METKWISTFFEKRIVLFSLTVDVNDTELGGFYLKAPKII